MTRGGRAHWASERFLLSSLQEMSCWDFPRHHARLSLPLTSAGGLSINTSLLSPTATAHQLCPADISRMKLLTGLIFCSLVLGVSSWLSFLGEAFQGAGDMWRAYSDMKEANWKNSDKYFHARGNYDAAQRGPGGVWAAEVISDARENIQSLLGRGHEDTMADQEANRHGRSGKDPNHYRPAGLPDKY